MSEEIVIAVLGSGVLSALISILANYLSKRQERKYAKEDKHDEVIAKLNCITKQIDAVEAKVDLNDVTQRRQRILRFADDTRQGIKHSKDSFDSVYADITVYNQYCAEHPEFKNEMTVASVGIIEDCFRERMQKNDFV